MMKNTLKYSWLIIASVFIFSQTAGQDAATERERIKLDQDWKFSLGHATDASKDFNHGTGYFSFFAKTGFGDGPAAKGFDDRAWRVLDLPHDWCVELPFAADGGHSHGYWAIGRDYPENSVGWYRKHFKISEQDLGKRISIEFDGVHRDAQVWVNGFYLGTEPCGSASFAYDITDYLAYGEENVVSVRVDVTMEEGWYYEGAGIVRSVWLLKTAPVHVARYGTFVTTEVEEEKAFIKNRTRVANESDAAVVFDIRESVLDQKGKVLSSGKLTKLELAPGTEKEYISKHTVKNPELWSLENPALHLLKTELVREGKVVDEYLTTFGIRTVRFDPEKGFFLNGEAVKIKGTNLHQDHAGVGRAVPPALHEFRIERMKVMGSNAVRTSHEPPDPAFLDACDRLGFLVLDENRLMGINDEHLELLENMMKRDRNHPSIFIWSLGNEEWAIEGSITGARITKTMQDFANRLDSSRAFTVAVSGGWDNGIGMVTQVMGFNYLSHGDIDEHHRKFPWQASIGTEESNTIGTRGIYETDASIGHMAYINDGELNLNAERGWKYYDEREYLAGLFYWTGIDYRGEPNPFAWPAVTSQFGITDLCGFPKDIFFYLKAWWTKDKLIHIFPHWNWQGREGDTIPVVVYSNCEEIELFLNDESLGKKTLQKNSHLRWDVVYTPGKLEARGYQDGEIVESSRVVTTGDPATVTLSANRQYLKADHEDLALITVRILDENNRLHPTADVDLSFTVEGPGKIIGVGNGDPSSHEPDQYISEVKVMQIDGMKELTLKSLDDYSGNAADYTTWKPFLKKPNQAEWNIYKDTLIAIRGEFDIPEMKEGATYNLFSKSIVEGQTVYINGHLIASDIERDAPGQDFPLDADILKEGKNEYVVLGQRFRLKYIYDEPNTDPGVVQIINPAEVWKRKTFNGLAQVIIQTTEEPGEIILKAESKLGTAEVKLRSIE
ncbi:MAG: DUF4982 domain-containing protein [Bacteroidales bacterium]|nr:DUF4982 domain-containing protein [Bacteroidales bacterium]